MAARRTEPRGGSIRLRAAIMASALIAIALIAVIACTLVAVRTSLVHTRQLPIDIERYLAS